MLTEKDTQSHIIEVDFHPDHQEALKFIDFGKKYVFFDRNINADNQQRMQGYSKLSTLPLPESLTEMFVYYENAKCYWCINSLASEYLHKLYNFNPAKLTLNNPQKLIYEYYLKWANSDPNLEDKYFALSVIKQIKDSHKNAINLILHATILAFDKFLFNPDLALELFQEVEVIIRNKNIPLEEEQEIIYIITLFKGFIHLKMFEYEKARKIFLDALQIKETGITAKFHIALANIYLDNHDEALELAQDIIQYDIDRINIVLDLNSIAIFERLMEYSVSREFFNDGNFFPLQSAFEHRVNNLISSGQERFKHLRLDLLNLKELKLSLDLDKEQMNNLEFMRMFTKYYQESNNMLVLEALVKVENKFVSTLESLLNSIQVYLTEEIEKQLIVYDKKIAENNEEVARLKSEIENNVQKNIKRTEVAIKSYQSSIDHKIKSFEEKIDGLDYKSELNPLMTFKNSITYTAVLSFLVVLLGGFAEYSNSYVQDIANFSKIITVIFISGSKWGIISFIVGIIISALASVSTSFERSKVKQKYTHYIAQLRKDKDSSTKRIKSEGEEAAKKTEARYKKSIKKNESQTKELFERKAADALKLKEKADERFKSETTKLSEILEHYKS